TRPDDARSSRNASAWRRPSSVRPAHPSGPAIGPTNPAWASPWRTRIRRITRIPTQPPRRRTSAVSAASCRKDSQMEGRPIGELLDLAVERPALEQVEVEVGRTLEDRLLSG